MGDEIEFLRTAVSFLDVASKTAEDFRSKTRRDFRSSLRNAIRAYWDGRHDYITFSYEMVTTLTESYREAWVAGARACGIRADEFTEDDETTLDAEVEEDIGYIGSFGTWIEEHSQANGGSLSMVLSRAELWENRYEAVKSHARSWFCGDQKLRWQFGDTMHCPDCENLNGRIYRASTWQKYDLAPRSRLLACGGYRCQCTLQITDEPVTPGRPPALVGPG